MSEQSQTENNVPQPSGIQPEATPQPDMHSDTPQEVAYTPVEVTPQEENTTYVDGKFDSVGKLEDSYRELQKSYSQKLGSFDGAPEAYAANEAFTNDPAYDMLTQWGQDNQMSQDGLDSLANQYQEFQYQQNEANLTAEFAKLGENASQRLDNARDFLVANIGESATEALGSNMGNAAAIEAIESLIGLAKAPKVAEAPANTAVSAEKVQAMRFATNENGDRLMSVDPSYRNKVLQAEASLVR